MTEPTQVIAHADSSQLISFEGIGLNGGDRAKWVRWNAESCESKWDMTNWVTISGKGGRWARFHFPPVPGPLILCYKFVYKGKPWLSPSAYIMHKNIRVNVVRFDKVTPNGTALGCQSHLTIEGKSFLGLGNDKTPNVTCGFGPDGDQMNATILNDTHMTCLTTVPYIPDAFPLRIDYRGLNTLSDPYVFPGFRAFHYNNSEIYRVAPGAGSYQFSVPVTIYGKFEDYGMPRCRFGAWMGSWARVINSSMAECDKPPFPNTERYVESAYPVTYTGNGQCSDYGYTQPGDWLIGTGASFRTYNAQVNALLSQSSPQGGTALIQITGEGFVYPSDPLGICRYVLQPASNTTVPTGKFESRTLNALSTTLLECPPPSYYGVGVYHIEVLQNGVNIDPTASGTPLKFELYDLLEVTLTNIEPRGGPIGEAATITITGTGFRDMGGGLVCVFSTNTSDFKGGAVSVPARLLSADKMLCTIPQYLAANPAYDGYSNYYVTAAVSLNGGREDTISISKAGFSVYNPPVITALYPTTGSAFGGYPVTLYGTGFSGLSTNPVTIVEYLRVAFGIAVQPLPVLINGTYIVVQAPPGLQRAKGTPIRIALNGVAFSTTDKVFEYVGESPPRLYGTHFTQDGSRLIVRFDGMPTNKGGMIGDGACALILDEWTATQLKGTAEENVRCGWEDELTLVAYLTMFTNATVGMRIGK